MRSTCPTIFEIIMAFILKCVQLQLNAIAKVPI